VLNLRGVAKPCTEQRNLEVKLHIVHFGVLHAWTTSHQKKATPMTPVFQDDEEDFAACTNMQEQREKPKKPWQFPG